MNKEFIPYQQALELKELGFDEACFGFWNLMNDNSEWFFDTKIIMNCFNYVKAPLYQQIFKWFRKNYNLFGCIDLQVCTPPHWFIRIDKIIENDYVYHSEDENLIFDTYEEAELACLKKLIEIVKQPKKD